MTDTSRKTDSDDVLCAVVPALLTIGGRTHTSGCRIWLTRSQADKLERQGRVETLRSGAPAAPDAGGDGDG